MKLLRAFVLLVITSPLLGYDELRREIQLSLQKGAIVIDVRTAEEYRISHYKNALHIPYDTIERRIHELSAYKNKTIIVYCRSGRRSGIAKQILEKHGFKHVINGINLSYFPQEGVTR